MPAGKMITADTTSSTAVLTMRLPIRSEMGAPEPTDSPKSPTSTPPNQSTYWVTSGRLSPRSARMMATASGVACRPRMATAASPGRACVAMNTTTETTHSDSTATPRRRMIQP